MVSLDQKHDFSQTFSRAYISKSPSGDADIVLIQDGADFRTDNPSRPILPDAQALPRQLVHIRVFWIPEPGTKADHPANTNASIHWCILGDDPRQSDMLDYSGSGLVEMDQSATDATIRIRNAWLKATTQHGNMSDPVGPSNIQGTIHAVADSAQVQAVLAQIKLAGGNQTDARVSAATPASFRQDNTNP